MSVAYLVSEYPAVSHTFIRREVEALRVRGLTVETFAIRAPPPRELHSDSDRRALRDTWSILPAHPGRILSAHLWAIKKAPRRYVSTLHWALRNRTPGMRNLLYSAFHFVEAVVLAMEMHRRGIRHIHSHFANSGGQIGLLASLYLKLGWSITLHGRSDFENPDLSGLREKIAIARFAVCVSDYGRAQAMRLASPDHWNKIHVVRCGLDLSEHPLLECEGDRSGRLRLLCVGRLAAEKGHLGLLEAFAAASEAGLDAELRIVGDGSERSRLEERIRALGVEDRCDLPGALGGAQLWSEYRRADVFVLASMMEGLPVTLIEAMASGLPVVAPRVAGIPELVNHQENGWLFTAGRWDELAQALLRAAAEPSRRGELARAGRRRVEEQHDSTKTVAPLYELLRIEIDRTAKSG
jgi:glycosyltransferase involved in cell wall biosynthesis